MASPLQRPSAMPDRNREQENAERRMRRIEYDLEWEEASPFGDQPSRPIRHLPPGGGIVEITTRTIHRRFLMRPSEQVNARIRGVLGRAQARHPEVELYGYWFLSNHFNVLAFFPEQSSLSAFMNFLDSNIAREIGRVHNWREKFWGRRYRGILLADVESQERRLAYLLAQGTKEGLVARPADWPGANCLAPLLTGRPDRGVWIDRTALYYARRRGEDVSEKDFEVEYSITLSPTPTWRTLRPETQRARAKALVEKIEEKAALERRKLRREPLGARRILAQNPHTFPRTIAKSPAPLCHSRGPTSFWKYANQYGGFLLLYRELSRRVREGDLSALVLFPPGCFPTRPPPMRLETTTRAQG